jgi:ferrous iron transport protein B
MFERLPVYAIIIALVIPDTRVEVFNLQGLTLMLLYLLGFGMAILLCFFEQNNENKGKTFFVVEMPNYKLLFKNVAINVIEKTKAFVYGAGKIILISIVLWFLASYGPGKNSTMPKNCNGKNLNNHWLQPNLKMQLLPKTGKLLYWSYGKND